MAKKGLHVSIKEQIELVELAEELDFDEAWFGEHHFNGFSNADELRELMFENVAAIDALVNQGLPLYQSKYISFENLNLQPKKLQEKIPFYIATFLLCCRYKNG